MSSEHKNAACGVGNNRGTYEKPRIKRVDLTLAETLSAACKVAGDDGPCDPLFGDSTQELGS